VPFVRGVRRLGLSLMAFSGYRLEELQAQRLNAVFGLLSATDVLVDGRYDASWPETERLWAGSTNQRFHYLTGRYTPVIERPEPGRPLRTVEIRIGPDGRLGANGWPAMEPARRRAPPSGG
jgi:anaerobic ribonucleoside-triphosphate reductase activating protein